MPEAHLEMSHLFWSSYKPYFTDQRSPTSSRHSRFAVVFQMLAFMDMLGTQSSLKTNIAVNLFRTTFIDITKYSSILFRVLMNYYVFFTIHEWLGLSSCSWDLLMV